MCEKTTLNVSLKATISGPLLSDCSQYEASKRLEIYLKGDTRCEAKVRTNSIWNVGPELCMVLENGDLIIEEGSQVKIGFVDLIKAKNIYNRGLVFTAAGGCIETEEVFSNEMLWNAELEDSTTQVGCVDNNDLPLIKLLTRRYIVHLPLLS